MMAYAAAHAAKIEKAPLAVEHGLLSAMKATRPRWLSIGLSS
jgi:hypothetical protein